MTTSFLQGCTRSRPLIMSSSKNPKRLNRNPVHSVLLGVNAGRSVSDVIGWGPLALTSRQREGRLALRLREAAGELGERFDERGAFSDAHLPQLHLLASCPLLCGLVLYLTTLPQVCFVPQHYDHHLHPKQSHVTFK